MTRPETSIVIRTFNEERYLPALLDAIGNQRYQDFEVINVDSGSYDRTTEIARKRGARLLRITPENFTFGYSLNVGVEAAQDSTPEVGALQLRLVQVHADDFGTFEASAPQVGV